MIYKKQIGVLLGICLFAGLVSLTPKPPKSAGAPAERTGALTVFSGKESTCSVSGCHDFFVPNSGNGILTIECVDCDNGVYKAGMANTIRISMQAAGFNKFGFQAVVLTFDSVLTIMGNIPVGVTEVLDPIRTQSLYSITQSEWMKGRKYITHTYDGNVALVPDSTSWEFSWIAPENFTDTVTIYVAASSADGDLEMAGDYIYTKSLSLGGMMVGIRPEEQHVDLRVYPNPASNSIYIRSSKQIEPMQLRIFTLGGAEVYYDMVRANKEILLDMSVINSGLYMFSLSQDNLILKQGKIVIQ